MSPEHKPLAWMHGEIKTPPFSTEARVLAGVLLRRLQAGETLEMPHSRPMPSIDTRAHELRIREDNQTWRIVYSLEPEAVVILDVFSKQTQRTPQRVLENARRRLKEYRDA